MGTPVVSEEVRAYFADLLKQVQDTYAIARAARARGFDPELDVEIPLTDDLASRVERLLEHYEVEGVARRIRELAKVHDREELAILVAKEMAVRPAASKEKAVERAVRVGLAILTEGILVAPLEGLATVKIKRNRDGSSYVDLSYAGPIRSAGGTGQALSVLIADVVRRELGIGRYQPAREEVERFKEEIPLYKQVQHLQYTPTEEEISLIVSNCPVAINGEGTEDAEISGFRDLPRIETNRIRGGACLVIADGMCLKAPKIQKHVRKLRIDGWEFIDAYMEKKNAGPDELTEDSGVEPSEVFIQNIVAGRPVLCHPSRAGGLRLRYGRTRATGLAAVALHPATMHILDDFIAVGTQIKTERPGKAGAVTPCDTIEGPLVVLDTGDFVEVPDAAAAKRLAGHVRVIADLGEILIPFGEFLENNHVLMPGAFSPEWYGLLLKKALGQLPAGWETATASQALAWSREFGVPLHPRHNLSFHDFAVEDLQLLRERIGDEGRLTEGRLVVPADEEFREWFVRLGVLYAIRGSDLVVERHTDVIMATLGIAVDQSNLVLAPRPETTDPLAFATALAGFLVKARGPTRIGARMARPEKAAPRKMQPAPHSLFPIGHEGGAQRLLLEAASKETIEVEVGLRICSACGKRWFLPKCSCGGHTTARNGPARQRVPLAEVLRTALERLGEPKPSEIKAVQGMISKNKTPEPIEKGVLRAKHEIYVFKDGTTRFDMTNLPHTHGGVLARIVGFTDAKAWFAHPYLIAARRRNCDGDEDSLILLLDCLINFSRSFLPDKRGGLMDAPLVLTTRIDPNEIDKEAHNLDLPAGYPLALFEAGERFAHPKEVEAQIDTVGKRIGSVLQYEGFAYTHETHGVAQGPLASAYGEGSMAEKIDKQLDLALRIRAVDPNDVVARIVVHHFLPDLIGNLKAFSSQSVRCTKCGAKYRRIPLRGRCLECSGNLTLTVHESSVKKYLEISKRISQQFEVSNYLRQRIDLIEEAITSLFTNDRTQDLKLDDFF